MVGDFYIAPKNTVQKLINYQFNDVDEEVFQDLVSKSFIHESKNVKHLEFLATRYRTLKSHVYGFTKLHIFVISLRCEHTCQYCCIQSF